MNGTAITDSLVDHFERTWAMLREAIENFPEESWGEAEDQRMLPARIGYHILLSTERYTWGGTADDFLPNRRFRLDWEAARPEDLPAKTELLDHFESMEAGTLEWVRGHG